mgnify:CR=1 FL=1
MKRSRVSDATSYKWRSKYGGMEVSDAKLKKLLAEQMMHCTARQGFPAKEIHPVQHTARRSRHAP